MHSPLRVARLPFAIASWGRVKTGALWNYSHLGLAFHSLLRVHSPPSRLCVLRASDFLCSMELARLWLAIDSPFTRHGELAFVFLLCFSSLLSVLNPIPAQMGKVRQIKRNRVFISYLSDFPSITCKTRNKRALIIQSKYYFLALITHTTSKHQALPRKPPLSSV